ncbi:3-oxo-5-alpha-steroid 4-dehydrogenase-domain-containing protein [Rhodocollybia butyracea]|uniref:very-long-chain enoyl-CoA reductase n=1 Tax=Rhodocollybia butyracea TaxID=206335 RepID=A0A9P5TWN0_9AGAR|nr:3-oxo-5-alpha-steroid 4-dehydrogenase-domain-containing protein [Rhodocollybia butyracea]
MAFSITVSAAANRAPTFARKSFPLTVETSLEDTVEDVKKKIQSKIPKFYASRQRLSLKSEKKALSDEAKLADISVSSGSELEVKDLGPQAGPLLIHPIFYYLPRLFYGTDVVHSDLQRMVFAMVEAHFGKRILETLFVHRFSHGTMPYSISSKSISAHYHILSGVFLAFDLYRPVFSASSMHIKGTIRNDQQFLWICAGLWTFFELSNLSTHLHLRSLRPAGTKKRAIPNGYGFGFVSCPNYFFETLAWAVVCAMTRSWAAYVFTAVGTGQMIKEFGKAYPRRKAMIPFMI